MNVIETDLPGVLLIQPKVFSDARGHFVEAFHEERYAAAGIAGPFVQDNVSRSRRGVLRGLHFQHPYGQRKLVTVLAGEVFDVAVDVRAEAPTFGRWTAHILSERTGHQLFIPDGFAHGFFTLSDEAVFAYKCSDYYRPQTERVLRWDDPEVGIQWPKTTGLYPLMSSRDANAASLREVAIASPTRASCPAAHEIIRSIAV